MAAICPGQDRRWRTNELFTCANCGAQEEIWTDELKVKCPQCGNWIFKEKVPSCVQWCKSARQCLGEERWQKLMGPDAEKKDKVLEEAKP